MKATDTVSSYYEQFRTRRPIVDFSAKGFLHDPAFSVAKLRPSYVYPVKTPPTEGFKAPFNLGSHVSLSPGKNKSPDGFDLEATNTAARAAVLLELYSRIPEGARTYPDKQKIQQLVESYRNSTSRTDNTTFELIKIDIYSQILGGKLVFSPEEGRLLQKQRL